MSLKLTDLKTENFSIKKNSSIFFSWWGGSWRWGRGGVGGKMVDEYIRWRGHTRKVELIIRKNIGLLYCARQVLTAVSLKTIRFSDIHLQLNYAWASRSVAKLNKIH